MRRIIIIAIVAVLAWKGYESYLARAQLSGQPATAGHAATTADSLFAAAQNSPAFRCDGRVSCPQMTSCAEARYFLSHCPGVKMDGDHDGVPCESQWCNSPGDR
jgi:Tfp pilus assembly major pilin PilA